MTKVKVLAPRRRHFENSHPAHELERAGQLRTTGDTLHWLLGALDGGRVMPEGRWLMLGPDAMDISLSERLCEPTHARDFAPSILRLFRFPEPPVLDGEFFIR